MTDATAQQFEPVTLMNVADGEVERGFQRQLAEVSSVLENAEMYETNKDGVLRCQIVLEIDIERQPDQTFVNIDARARLKTPKFRRTSRMAFYVEGSFTVPKLKQGDLFGKLPAPSKVTPLRVAERPATPTTEDPL